MSQYQLPSGSGMTPSKRLRAVAPAILVLVAFLAYYAIVHGTRQFAIVKRADAKFPMVSLYWGLDRIVSSGTTVPFYFDGTKTENTPRGVLVDPPNVDLYIDSWRSSQPKPLR